jgi:hypothetical protein
VKKEGKRERFSNTLKKVAGGRHRLSQEDYIALVCPAMPRYVVPPACWCGKAVILFFPNSDSQ